MLDALYKIAMENVGESPAQHSHGYNHDAVVPNYAAAYNGLQHDLKTNTGRSTEFKIRYTGAFLTEEW
jgi:hypothetical protein